MQTGTLEKEATQTEIVLPTIAEVEKQLPTKPTIENISEDVKANADQWIENVFSIGSRDLDNQLEVTKSVKSLGNDVELRLAEQSKLLQGPLSELMQDADSGGDVAQDLLKMEDTARSIDPNGFDFTTVSGLRRFMSVLGLPTPLQTWIAKYQSTDSILKSIVKGLEQGKSKLERDNMTLKEDQVRYRHMLFKLDDYITFAEYVDQALEVRLEQVQDPEQKRFLTDEVAFPVRQRLQDLMTSKGVYQQAWVVSEVLIKTNEELVRGVDRAIKHTMVALGIAASLAVALARQKKILKAVQSSKEMTEKMIVDVADKLESQGVEILTQASEPFIQVEVMKLAFTKSLNALENVSNYRREALESMKTGCSELKQMTTEMDKNIARIEQGHQAREEYQVFLQ
ncbi:toxic anion resistance protein [Vibrio fluminensis]|uniref:toxic anion resistance protein n=1 Tax=Vibrio fluminensis TaxID=2783614 RepID=UPI0018877578|nr:toxic anion resistance protein [Vibrio fluminensis]